MKKEKSSPKGYALVDLEGLYKELEAYKKECDEWGKHESCKKCNETCFESVKTIIENNCV